MSTKVAAIHCYLCRDGCSPLLAIKIRLLNLCTISCSQLTVLWANRVFEYFNWLLRKSCCTCKIILYGIYVQVVVYETCYCKILLCSPCITYVHTLYSKHTHNTHILHRQRTIHYQIINHFAHNVHKVHIFYGLSHGSKPIFRDGPKQDGGSNQCISIYTVISSPECSHLKVHRASYKACPILQ